MILIPRHCELDEMQQVLAAETNGAGLVAVAVAAQTPSGARDRQQSERQREKQRERSCNGCLQAPCSSICVLSLLPARFIMSTSFREDDEITGRSDCLGLAKNL